MDTDPGSIIFQIVILFVLIFVNAFFAMSEIAVISLNDNKMKKNGGRRQQKSETNSKVNREQ